MTAVGDIAKSVLRGGGAMLGWALLAGAPLWLILLLGWRDWLALFQRLDWLAFFHRLLLG